VAGLRFSARSGHADGSCDDYYPFERALGAAVFSLLASARAYRILGLDDPGVLGWLRRRADWVMRHDESGHLANHQALAALGLWEVAQLTGDPAHRRASRARIARVLAWQSDEGWFDEYGGADPGYQTVTIDCLAKYHRQTGDAWLVGPLRRAVDFARLFLHPDGSYGGPYGSRGTYHFYPHGFEILAAENSAAADLGDGFLRSLALDTQAHFSDDRMFAHRTANLLEAYLEWSPNRPPPEAEPSGSRRYLPQAQLLVSRSESTHTVVSAARGGTLKHFARDSSCITDAGLVVETADGRVAVSQRHDRQREVVFQEGGPAIQVRGQLDWARHETATPLKQALFHLGMVTLGRCCRTLVRRLLQRLLITGRGRCPIRLTRRVEFLAPPASGPGPGLRVTDTIELLDRAVRVRRMSFGSDHETAYVAASGVYQDSVLRPWTDLAVHVEALNARREVTIVREFS
jgi:hypothetical protein